MIYMFTTPRNVSYFPHYLSVKSSPAYLTETPAKKGVPCNVDERNLKV